MDEIELDEQVGHEPREGDTLMSKLVKAGSTEVQQHKPGDTWSYDKIRECAKVFTSTGSYTKTSALTGVKRVTIAAWEHRNNEVWVEACTTLQHEKNKELRNKYVAGAEKALDHTMKTLKNATPAQGAVISGIFLDKSRNIDSLPNSSDVQDYKALAEQCKELSRTMRDHRVVSVQQPDDEDDNTDK